MRTENVKTRLRKILQLQQDVYLLRTAIQKENVSAAASLLRNSFIGERHINAYYITYKGKTNNIKT